MFSATRKKFVEGVESDYPDESMYYGQPSMFPHRSEKDVSVPQHVPNLGEGDLVQGSERLEGVAGCGRGATSCFYEKPLLLCRGSFIAFFFQKANVFSVCVCVKKRYCCFESDENEPADMMCRESIVRGEKML